MENEYHMFRMSNEDYPTLESTISSLTANLSSAVSSSHDPGVLLFLYYMKLIGTFQLFFNSSYLHKTTIRSILTEPFNVRIPYKRRYRHIRVPSLLVSINSVIQFK